MGEVIKMENPQVEDKKKLSYEELENIANELHNKCNELFEALQNANLQNMFTRLDFLFKVLKNSKEFDAEFVSLCVEEIKNIMIIKEPNKTEE
jgi:hypothetical protein